MPIKDIEANLEEVKKFTDFMMPIVTVLFPEVGAGIVAVRETQNLVSDTKDDTTILKNQQGSADGLKKLMRNYHIISIREKAHTMIPVLKALLEAGNRGIVAGEQVWDEKDTERQQGGKLYRIVIDYRVNEDSITIEEEDNHEGETGVQMMTEVMQNFGTANDLATVDLQYQSIIEIRVHKKNILALIERVVNWYEPKNVAIEDNGQVNSPNNADLSRVFGYKSLNAPENNYWLSQSLRFLVPMWFNGIQSH